MVSLKPENFTNICSFSYMVLFKLYHNFYIFETQLINNLTNTTGIGKCPQLYRTYISEGAPIVYICITGL